MADYTTLDWQIDRRVLTLTLNRPAQLNAFTVEMANELVDAYTRASEDDAVGAIVVTGAGRAFCAGMDLSVGGNVFGLDESLDPSLAELDARWDDPEILSAEQALAGRLVKAVVPAEQLLDQAHALAHQYIDHRSPVAIALARQMLMRNHAAPHPRDAHAVESLAMMHTSRNDGREGVASFNQKRLPEYGGRASDGLPAFYPWW